VNLNCTAVPVRTVGILRSSMRTILERAAASPRSEDWRLLHFSVVFESILSANIFLSQLDQFRVLHKRFDNVAYCTETGDELDGKGSVHIPKYTSFPVQSARMGTHGWMVPTLIVSLSLKTLMHFTTVRAVAVASARIQYHW
jgi:hypothetical protein